MNVIENTTVMRHLLLDDGKMVFFEVFNVTLDLLLDRRFVLLDLGQTILQAGLGTDEKEKVKFFFR